eukprot:3941031-Rhodomonas_salina.1
MTSKPQCTPASTAFIAETGYRYRHMAVSSPRHAVSAVTECSNNPVMKNKYAVMFSTCHKTRASRIVINNTMPKNTPVLTHKPHM